MSWTDDVQHFIEVSKTVSSAGDLERLVSDITREMGFDYFALIHPVDLSAMEASLSHMADGSLVALTNYPEAWVEAYVARNIVANDPVLLASERTSAGFRCRSESVRRFRRKLSFRFRYFCCRCASQVSKPARSSSMAIFFC